jgi:hypothetical protein
MTRPGAALRVNILFMYSVEETVASRRVSAVNLHNMTAKYASERGACF